MINSSSTTDNFKNPVPDNFKNPVPDRFKNPAIDSSSEIQKLKTFEYYFDGSVKTFNYDLDFHAKIVNFGKTHFLNRDERFSFNEETLKNIPTSIQDHIKTNYTAIFHVSTKSLEELIKIWKINANNQYTSANAALLRSIIASTNRFSSSELYRFCKAVNISPNGFLFSQGSAALNMLIQERSTTFSPFTSAQGFYDCEESKLENLSKKEAMNISFSHQEELNSLIKNRDQLCKSIGEMGKKFPIQLENAKKELALVLANITKVKSVSIKKPEELKTEILSIMKEAGLDLGTGKMLLGLIKDIGGGHPAAVYTAHSQLESILEMGRGCKDVVLKDKANLEWVFVDESFKSVGATSLDIQPGWYTQDFISIMTGFDKAVVNERYKGFYNLNSFSNAHSNMPCKEIGFNSKYFGSEDTMKVQNSEARLQFGKWEIKLLMSKKPEDIKNTMAALISNINYNDPMIAQQIGRGNLCKLLQEELNLWADVREAISDIALEGKFLSRPDLMIKLLLTKSLKGRKMAYFKADSDWGTGIGDDQNKSLNLLGKSLERIRESFLKKSEQEILKEINSTK